MVDDPEEIWKRFIIYLEQEDGLEVFLIQARDEAVRIALRARLRGWAIGHGRPFLEPLTSPDTLEVPGPLEWLEAQRAQEAGPYAGGQGSAPVVLLPIPREPEREREILYRLNEHRDNLREEAWGALCLVGVGDFLRRVPYLAPDLWSGRTKSLRFNGIRPQSPAHPYYPLSRLEDPPHSRFLVPYASLGDGFVGRETELLAVRQSLVKKRHLCIIGPPGIGKTRLAVEYAYRYAQNYDGGVVFVEQNAGERTLRRLGQMVAIEADGLAELWPRLRPLGAWLLVLDEPLDGNLDDWSVSFGDVHMLCTAEKEQSGHSLGAFVLTPLAMETSLALLCQQRQPVAEEDRKSASVIASCLAGLPLGLSLAGSLLAARQAIAWTDYQAMLEVHDACYREGPAHERALLVALAVTFAHCTPLVGKLLTILAQFGGCTIPTAIVRTIWVRLAPGESGAFDGAVEEAKRYALLEGNDSELLSPQHIGPVPGFNFNDDLICTVCEEVLIEEMERIDNPLDTGAPVELRDVAPHALFFMGLAQVRGRWKAVYHLALCLSVYRRALGDLGWAITTGRKALDAAKHLEPKASFWDRIRGRPPFLSPLRAKAEHVLAQSYLLLDSPATARPLLERVLQAALTREDALLIAQVRRDLARMENTIGQPKKARSLLQQALEQAEKELGPETLIMAELRADLGLLLIRHGEMDPARHFLWQALLGTERELGPEHPMAVAVRRKLVGMNQQSQQSPPVSIRLFYLYAGVDEPLRRELDVHLAVLQRQGVLKSWDGLQVSSGQDWRREGVRGLTQADLVLVLVSDHLLSSMDIYQLVRDVPHSGTRLVPVILRLCPWQQTPLGRFSALPRSGKPIIEWPYRDEAWLEVVQHIRQAVLSLPPGVEKSSGLK